MFSAIHYRPLGFEQISAATLAAATPLTVPAGATVVIIKSNAASVSWRDDGVDPTASIGVIMQATDYPLEYSGNLAALRFILVSGSPTLNVSYYKSSWM